ncbi:hypothetical protein MKY37_02215 [Psychrobacillus sp. FSL K6-2836]|uniref:hypothetical protein n=1 Tax=Psychrobacillus sp. FSL K6-2836 TaxID=2921548 RepID=UPI0030F4B46F
MKEDIQDNKTLSKSEAAKTLNISKHIVSYIISRDEFAAKIGKTSRRTFIPIDLLEGINNFYQTNRNQYHKFQSDPKYLSARHLAGFLAITYENLIQQAESGLWDGKYVKIPRVTFPTRKENNHFNYFFNRKLTIGNYKTLSAIIIETKIVPRDTLLSYAKNGLLPQPEHLKGTNLYDENEIIRKLPYIRDEQFQKKTGIIKSSKIQSFMLLNEQQQHVITEYLNYRRNNGTINFNGYRSKNKIVNKEKTLIVMKELISSAFVLIIAGRCNITEDIFVRRKLNSNIIDLFNPDVFNILNISNSDYFYLYNKRKESTLSSFFKQLRPFYYYHLQKLEIESTVSQQKFLEFQGLKIRIEQFLDQFPYRNSNWYETQNAKINKSFLTPIQMIEIKNFILSDPISVNPIKYATMWQLGCTTGVRPEEMQNVRIEHFLLDNNGFLKLNSRGWGLLRLPASASKHESSPSNIYGTLIPIETVNQLNNYLKLLYKKQGPLNKTGFGYLFRPHDPSPNREYDVIVKDFIVRIRTLLTFLSKEQQERFVLKSSRHSMNNLISNSFLSVPYLNGRIQKTSAQYQMRHKPFESTGDKYYSALISEDDFYKVLDLTINFPWDKDKLQLWEIKQGYIKANINEFVDEENSYQVDYSEEIAERIKDIDNQLANLRKRPKTMDVKEWTIKVSKLNKEKNKLLNIS